MDDIFDSDGIVRKDLCERLLSGLLRDDPDQNMITRLWDDFEDLNSDYTSTKKQQSDL